MPAAAAAIRILRIMLTILTVLCTENIGRCTDVKESSRPVAAASRQNYPLRRRRLQVLEQESEVPYLPAP